MTINGWEKVVFRDTWNASKIALSDVGLPQLEFLVWATYRSPFSEILFMGLEQSNILQGSNVIQDWPWGEVQGKPGDFLGWQIQLHLWVLWVIDLYCGTGTRLTPDAQQVRVCRLPLHLLHSGWIFSCWCFFLLIVDLQESRAQHNELLKKMEMMKAEAGTCWPGVLGECSIEQFLARMEESAQQYVSLVGFCGFICQVVKLEEQLNSSEEVGETAWRCLLCFCIMSSQFWAVCSETAMQEARFATHVAQVFSTVMPKGKGRA